MTTCSVRWRPSGGRGEFEFVPADALVDREILIDFGPLGVIIPAEVRGVHAQGKPRLRKFDKNNRQKFHLPQLVMAVAGLPEPAREDLRHGVQFPLENKAFVMDAMDFDVIEDDGLTVTLAPLRVSVLRSSFQVDLGDRLAAIARDVASIADIRTHHPDLADAVEAHRLAIEAAVNSTALRATADRMIDLKTALFGQTNAGSALELTHAEALPETDLEEPVGKEGRILVRLHAYKERDRTFAKRVRDHYRRQHGGQLHCEACSMVSEGVYGPNGERCMEAHHKIPIEELQPDSVTPVQEMAMVCANCHRVIHSAKPCLTIDQVKGLLAAYAGA